MENKKDKLDENQVEKELEKETDSSEAKDKDSINKEAKDKEKTEKKEVSDTSESNDDEKQKSKGKKIKNPLKKKDKKDEKIDELEDKYQRLFAEFQNYRSRSEKEKSAMYEVGARAIIEKILPVVDNLERGITALSEEDLDSPVGQGMNLIYKQMATALDEMGVTAIESEGMEFDPELHNAVMHEDNDELGENMVSQTLQKGYKYRDTVIRHSMVKVAN